MSVFVICEAGVNHNGNFDVAMDMVHAARDTGANAVKFQLFKDRPEIEHLRISEECIAMLHEECQKTGIEFMCTPFYGDAVDFLDPLVKRHKIASGWTKKLDIFNRALITGKPVIASMGMTDPTTSMPNLEDVSYLHCVSLYPCPDENANLGAIQAWADGYSDHTTGITACIAAAALGAEIIEKHFTFDKTQPGPDHSCSAEPEEFAEMVRHIRRIERML